jgi:hypothetical protein
MREISNQYLPNKQNFQTKWVDFPNHLHPKEEVAFESEQEEMKEEAIVEHYLPFSHPTHSALEEKMNPEKKEGIFQSFKESSQRGNNRDKWRSFLQEKPTRTRFTPSTVPSILKGMTPIKTVKKQVAYEELENELKRDAEELLIFSSEETPLVTVEEVEVERKSQKIEKQTPLQKRVNTSLSSSQMVQETLLKTLPDTQSMEVLAPELKPLPGKQRRAMNRSLSWIMEQEQGKDTLPYSKK